MKTFITLLLFIIPTAAASYQEGLQRDCLPNQSTGINIELGHNQSLPISIYNGNQVPIITQTFLNQAAFIGGYTPFVLGIGRINSSDGNGTRMRWMADLYWNGEGMDSKMDQWVAGRFRSTTNASMNVNMTVEFSFENQTAIFLSNNGGADIADIHWSGGLITLDETSQYHYLMDAWNVTDQPELNPRFFYQGYEDPTTCDFASGATNTYGGIGNSASIMRQGLDGKYFVYYHSETVPSAPQNLTATPGDHSIFVEWDPPLSSGATPIEGYKVYRQDTITMTPTLIATLNATEYLDKPLVCIGPGFNYSVSAFNSIGEGPATEWSGFKFPLCRSGTLFGGDNAQIYGPGGKAGLAQTLGISPDAAGYFWGFLLLLAFAMVGGILGNMAGNMIMGGIIGSAIGLALTTMWGMIPWWATFFIVMASAATFLILSRRQEAI